MNLYLYPAMDVVDVLGSIVSVSVGRLVSQYQADQIATPVSERGLF